eukprot:GHUV01018331.1.p3 GENE.GHUV01018331.1~~GHUV01018331.1.p3  ORF type:complete len:174 (-),score=25.10 GHUV01018331.1:1462-1983(-)
MFPLPTTKALPSILNGAICRASSTTTIPGYPRHADEREHKLLTPTIGEATPLSQLTLGIGHTAKPLQHSTQYKHPAAATGLIRSSKDTRNRRALIRYQQLLKHTLHCEHRVQPVCSVCANFFGDCDSTAALGCYHAALTFFNKPQHTCSVVYAATALIPHHCTIHLSGTLHAH